MKKLTLFKLVDVDIESERKRINRRGGYNKRQKLALNTLLDFFERGEFQQCLDFINDKKNFPYNDKKHYDEKEHIGMEISDILHDVAYNNYYTQPQLLKQAAEKLVKDARKVAKISAKIIGEKSKESLDWVKRFNAYFANGPVERTPRK